MTIAIVDRICACVIGGRTTSEQCRQVHWVGTLVSLSHSISTGACRRHPLTRIVKPSPQLTLSSSLRQATAACDRPAREPALTPECEAACCFSGVVRAPLRHNGQHSRGILTSFRLALIGCGVLGGDRWPPKTAKNRARDDQCRKSPLTRAGWACQSAEQVTHY